MNKFRKIYQDLVKQYGKPVGQWSLWCKRPKLLSERERIIIETILVQRTNWRNVEQAEKRLRAEKIFSLKKIKETPIRKLSFLIKPAGFYRRKAYYLKGLADFIVRNYKDLKYLFREDWFTLRSKLISLPGIGPETADSILLYALDKPVFVIDEYTRRLVKRKALSPTLSYNFLQKLFMENLKGDFRLYQDFHALIVIDGQRSKR